MIIECPYCESKVDGKIIGEHAEYGQEDPCPFKILLVQCPVCKCGLVGCQELIQTGPNTEEWVNSSRLWPQPHEYLSQLIPDIVRNSLNEAKICYKARAYSACAVMCGRALEGICRFYKTKSENLYSGLKELLEKKIIDERLYQWGEALREERNLGAHASEEAISKEDAQDLLDFANAICEYIFVLSDQFEKYMQRKGKTKGVAEKAV